jgi:L-malate glycosyltransferase
MLTRKDQDEAFDKDLGRQRVAFVWDQFSPYHVDRCEHVAHTLGNKIKVIGIEFASKSSLYAWPEARATKLYMHVTLFPGISFEETKRWKRFYLLMRCCLRYRIEQMFVAGYDRPEIFLISLLARLSGRRVFVMAESKFDDKQRFWLKEIPKVCALAPYHGAFAGGKRTAEYLQFLGFAKRPVALGYDAISVERVRSNAEQGSREQTAFKDRYFVVVARYVEKKNLLAALKAYALYAQARGMDARQLHLVGSGPLESQLQDYILSHNLQNIVLHGFMNEMQIAQVLKAALAMLLPSVEEQWGLVINEALALNLPVLVSTNVGARDTLVRQGVNGFVIEPSNIDGWAWCMRQLCQSEELWSNMATASSRMASLGDVAEFSQGCAKLLGYAGAKADLRLKSFARPL